MAKKTPSEPRRKFTVDDLQHYKHNNNTAITDNCVRPVMLSVDCQISNLQCKAQCTLEVTAKKRFLIAVNAGHIIYEGGILKIKNGGEDQGESLCIR